MEVCGDGLKDAVLVWYLGLDDVLVWKLKWKRLILDQPNDVHYKTPAPMVMLAVTVVGEEVELTKGSEDSF